MVRARCRVGGGGEFMSQIANDSKKYSEMYFRLI